MENSTFYEIVGTEYIPMKKSTTGFNETLEDVKENVFKAAKIALGTRYDILKREYLVEYQFFARIFIRCPKCGAVILNSY
jgi:hypothetical protein